MMRKLKDDKGLTLVEMLCAVVMLTILCLIMSTGLQMAVKSYREVTAQSETQLLLSSLSDVLSDKLRYCVVTAAADGTVKKTSIGGVGTDEDGNPVVTGIAISADKRVTADGRELLPAGSYGNGRYEVSKLKVIPAVNAGAATFTVMLAVKDISGSIGAEAELKIRCLNPVRIE